MSLRYNIYIKVVFNTLGKVVNFVHQSMQFFRGIRKIKGRFIDFWQSKSAVLLTQIPLKKSKRCIYLHAKNLVRQLVNSTPLRQSCVTLSCKTCHRLWIYLSNESEFRRLTNNFYLTFINPVDNFLPVLLLTLKPDLLNSVSLFPRTEMCRV